jgi:hypothetical protein
MIPEVLTFPADPDPCKTTDCNAVSQSVEECRDRSCPFRYARERVEARQRDQELDAKSKEDAA